MKYIKQFEFSSKEKMCSICDCKLKYQFEIDQGICDGCYSDILHSDKKIQENLTGKTNNLKNEII